MKKEDSFNLLIDDVTLDTVDRLLYAFCFLLNFLLEMLEMFVHSAFIKSSVASLFVLAQLCE